MKSAIAQALKPLFIAILGLVTLLASWQRPFPGWGGPSWTVGVFLLAILLFFVNLGLARTGNTVGTKRVVIAAVLVGIVVRMLWIALVDNDQVSDFAVYHELAVALVTGQGYTLTGPTGLEDVKLYLGPGVTLPAVTAYRAPGTSLWGALLYLVAGTRPFVFKIANLALDGILIGLIASVARRGRLDTRAAGLAALSWALYPSAIFATGLFGTEILFAFLLVLIAWLFARCDVSAGRRPLVGAALIGLACAAGILVRSMSIPVVGAMLLTTLLAGASAQRGARTAIALFFLAAGLLPWTYRNWTALHRFVPVSTSEGEFLGRHTMPFVPEELKDADWQKRFEDWRALSDEVDRAREGYAISTDNLTRMLKGGPAYTLQCVVRAVRSNFAGDLDLLAWSTLRFHEKTKNPGLQSAIARRTRLYLSVCTGAFYLAILAGALAGVIVLRPADFLASSGLAFLAFSFLGAFAALASVVGQHRYHFGLMPFIVIISAHGYSTLAARWLKK